jgi:hypothetical protein
MLSSYLKFGEGAEKDGRRLNFSEMTGGGSRGDVPESREADDGLFEATGEL